MAKTVVNPAAELPPRSGDIHLALEQLSALTIFASIKKAPTFAKFPGSFVLRHYQPGDVICHQGQPGRSAFYLLTGDDLRALGDVPADPTSGDNLRPLHDLVADSAQLTQQTPDPSDAPRKLARALLLGGSHAEGGKRRSLWGLLPTILGAKPARQKPDSPTLIPNDGPADIDYESREAAIFEGEVFGEMSCLTRQPRSATVVADQECFALEILRNILDQMRKDPHYKQQSEQKYRERVMEGHLRGLKLFSLLTSEEFAKIVGRVELVDFTPGTVLWDEGDPSDAVYVVRSGIVKVVQSFPWQMNREAVNDWTALTEELIANRESKGPISQISSALSDDLWSAIEDQPGELTDVQKELLLEELNQLAKRTDLLTSKALNEQRADARYQRETSEFDSKVKSWTGLQIRRANRVLFHVLFPEIVAPPDPPGIQRVLRYLGRGDTLGEIGLALDQPRTATCVAYAHPGQSLDTLNVELVRVSAELFHELVKMSPAVRAEVEQLVQGRMDQDTQLSKVPIHAVSSSRRAERLGLLQGQKLMLIDLDRCTRCGDCVQACIETHDDGFSRLFLDGPRFGKYLIPSSCRNCRDPVCMIGCPVGSIQQGAQGEVLIRDWCIGCGVCARQCPYDAIQMHDVSIIPSTTAGWRWSIESFASGGKWNSPDFRDKHWQQGSAPFRNGIDIRRKTGMNGQSASGQSAGSGPTKSESNPQRPILFRYRFDYDSSLVTMSGICRLLVTSQGSDLTIYLNGQLLELSQDARQAKKGISEANLSTAQLRDGSNLLAVSVASPPELNDILLDLRLDAIAAEQEHVEEKTVTESAVVCDQCSSLSGDRHACVYACPHDAALRIDAWTEFPGM